MPRYLPAVASNKPAFEAMVANVDLPVNYGKKRRPFWSKNPPELDHRGKVIKGGMWPHQKAWWELDSFIKVLVAGYGGGKTFIGAKRIITLALTNAPVAVAAVSPTFPQAKKTIVPTIENLLAGKKATYGKAFWWRYNKVDHVFTIRYHGRQATIYVLSGEDPDSLRGPNLGAAWLDEPFLMEKSVFEQMLARVRHPDASMIEINLTGCVTRDSWVVTKQGMKRIGDLDPGTKPKEYKKIDVDVLGIHNEYHKATKFFNNGRDETVKMTLTNGYQIEGTPDHPVLCMGEDGVPVFKRMGWRKGKYAHLGQLKLGDSVALARGADVWGNLDPLKDFENGDIKMDKELAYFLGLWIAEGSVELSQNRVGISCGDKSVTEWLAKVGVLGETFTYMCNVTWRLYSRKLLRLMQHLGMPLTTAPYKYIPQWVFAGKREWALAFLAGMYDGDGHVCKDGSKIGYSTSSEKLAVDLQQLWMNLGVVTHRDQVWNRPTEKVKVWSLAHHLVARSANGKKMAELLPLRIARKRKQLAVYRRKMRDSDKIPHQRRLILEAWEQRDNLRWRKGGSKLEANKIIEVIRKHSGAIAYSTLRDFTEMWKRNEWLPSSEICQLNTNLNDGYYWAKVEKLEKGSAETVDFVIPDTHTFSCNAVICNQTPEALNWGFDLCMGDLKADLEELGELKVGMIQASTRDNLCLSPAYVKRLQGAFTDRMSEAYIEGGFVNLSEGLVYYGYTTKDEDPQKINAKEFPSIPDAAELGCGMDFNVNPMSAAVFWRMGPHMHFFDEFELPNADTEYLCQTLHEKYVGDQRVTRQQLHYIYPDATGAHRKTSAPAGKTDFHFIREAGFEIKANWDNPKRKDRYNAVNGKFRPKEGVTTLTVDPKRCKKLNKYLQTYAHELMNKQEAMSHLLDAFSYPVSHLFPIAHDRAEAYRLSGK